MMSFATRCASLHASLELEAEADSTGHMAITAFYLAHEHHGAILELLESGRLGSALALLRPCFEALMIGLWLQRGATEQQIEKYVEQGITPNVEMMLRNLRKSPTTEEDAFLAETWELSKGSLHRYTHCSFQLLARRSNGALTDEEISEDEIANFIRFATGTALLATVELARIGSSKELENVAMRYLAQLYPPEPVTPEDVDDESKYVQGLTDEEHRENHKQAHLIAAKLSIMSTNLIRNNPDYFQENFDRLIVWDDFLKAAHELADKKNFFDVCISFDQFLMKAFLADAPIFPHEVIQDFSDVRAGKE
ncbi:hypothetical protein B5P43_10435 [Bacillus sp. SRB_336]|nr:hypothetical protein B5P43_10435 [Bacillus sp. SRB_336]